MAINTKLEAALLTCGKTRQAVAEEADVTDAYLKNLLNRAIPTSYSVWGD